MSERLTGIERRVLAYLDQRGPRDRIAMVCDMSSPTSKIGRMGGRINGSNGGAPLIAGRWTARLIKMGLVSAVYSKAGFYRHHEITVAGRDFLRSSSEIAA